MFFGCHYCVCHIVALALITYFWLIRLAISFRYMAVIARLQNNYNIMHRAIPLNSPLRREAICNWERERARISWNSHEYPKVWIESVDFKSSSISITDISFQANFYNFFVFLNPKISSIGFIWRKEMPIRNIGMSLCYLKIWWNGAVLRFRWAFINFSQ